jgi:hypothetical protein
MLIVLMPFILIKLKPEKASFDIIGKYFNLFLWSIGLRCASLMIRCGINPKEGNCPRFIFHIKTIRKMAININFIVA